MQNDDFLVSYDDKMTHGLTRREGIKPLYCFKMF